MKKLITSIILLLTLSTRAYCISEKDVIQMYASVVDQWREQIVIAFDNAEKEVYRNNVPVVPVGPIPNEDPAKCPCKGTGVITHGDGHDTPCPFHSKEFGSMEDKNFICECDSRCACEKCECIKMETK